MGTIAVRGWESRKTKVRRDVALARVKENYEKHKAQYEEACAGYKLAAATAIEACKARFAEAIAELADRVGASSDAKPIPLALPGAAYYFGLEVPVSHADEYEVVLDMLTTMADDVVEFNTEEYSAFLLDQWGWKDKFAAVHSNYSNFRKTG